MRFCKFVIIWLSLCKIIEWQKLIIVKFRKKWMYLLVTNCCYWGLIQFHWYWARPGLFVTPNLSGCSCVVPLLLPHVLEIEHCYFSFCEAWDLRTCEILKILIAELPAFQIVEYFSVISTKIESLVSGEFPWVSKLALGFASLERLLYLIHHCFVSIPSQVTSVCLGFISLDVLLISILERWFLCICVRPHKP